MTEELIMLSFALSEPGREFRGRLVNVPSRRIIECRTVERLWIDGTMKFSVLVGMPTVKPTVVVLMDIALGGLKHVVLYCLSNKTIDPKDLPDWSKYSDTWKGTMLEVLL